MVVFEALWQNDKGNATCTSCGCPSTCLDLLWHKNQEQTRYMQERWSVKLATHDSNTTACLLVARWKRARQIQTATEETFNKLAGAYKG